MHDQHFELNKNYIFNTQWNLNYESNKQEWEYIQISQRHNVRLRSWKQSNSKLGSIQPPSKKYSKLNSSSIQSSNVKYTWNGLSFIEWEQLNHKTPESFQFIKIIIIKQKLNIFW